jgi:RNA-binding protein YhbY
MKNLTVAEIKKLKSRAHHLKPVIQLGKNGITPALITAIDKALFDQDQVPGFQGRKEGPG